MMSGFAILSLISMIICLALGLWIYFKNVRFVFDNKLSRILCFLCLTLAFCWAIVEFGYRHAPNFEVASFWLKINVTWYIVISLLIHLALIYTENYKLLKRKLTYFIIYGPALLFFIIDISSNLLYTIPYKTSWGWSFGTPANPIIHTISSTWAAFAAVFCLYVFLDYYFKSYNHYKKIQTKIAIIGISIPVITGLNTEFLLPILGIKFPELLVPSLTIGLVIIWYGKWIYNPDKNKVFNNKIKKDIDKIINVN